VRLNSVVQLILTACMSLASPAHADDAFADAKSGFVFPRTLAGLGYENRREYGDPRLGYGVNYRGEGIFVTVIVYDLGEQSIGDGIDDARVRQQMRQAQADVAEAVRRGDYREAIADGEAKQYSPLFLQASYRILAKNGAQYRSYIFVRGQKRHFIKVRATGLTTSLVDASMAAMLDQLAVVIGTR
jgi:hypothetical protein